jgi:hypothetical protein
MKIKMPTGSGVTFWGTAPPLTPCAILVSCKCVPENPAAPFGSVISGEIILSAHLIMGKLAWLSGEWSEKEGPVPALSIGMATLEFHPDEMLPKPPKQRKKIKEKDRVIYALWMASRYVGGRGESALILESVAGTRPHVYRRLGMLETYSQEASYLATLFIESPRVSVTII